MCSELFPLTMENLVKKWGNMSLDDREGGEFQLNKNASSADFTFDKTSTEYRVYSKNFQYNLDAKKWIQGM